jgi:FG-GAP repeat protein
MKLYQLKQNPFTIFAALVMAALTLASAQSAAVISQQAYLKASNTGASDDFGCSVAVSGDTLVVGACSEDSNAIGINGNQTNNNATDSGADFLDNESLGHAFLLIPEN